MQNYIIGGLKRFAENSLQILGKLIALKQDNLLHWLIKIMFATCPSRY